MGMRRLQCLVRQTRMPKATGTGATKVRSPARRAQSTDPLAHISRGVKIRQDDLFHAFSRSPCADLQRRAAVMKANAYCPHASHHPARLPLPVSQTRTDGQQVVTNEAPKLVRFECPDCGLPAYCCEEHWADDYETHIELCDLMRQANEDEHDLRSGRVFPEFEMPGPQDELFPVNMTNWDTYLYSRQFEAINDDRSLRQATRLLTYPMTIASIVSELSPYDLRKTGRFTTEGVRSFSGGSEILVCKS